jgi:hypothetical protein
LSSARAESRGESSKSPFLPSTGRVGRCDKVDEESTTRSMNCDLLWWPGCRCPGPHGRGLRTRATAPPPVCARLCLVVPGARQRPPLLSRLIKSTRKNYRAIKTLSRDRQLLCPPNTPDLTQIFTPACQSPCGAWLRSSSGGGRKGTISPFASS